MSIREDARRAEEFLLQFLREQHRPVTISEIIEQANTQEGRRATDSFDIRSTIWSLVEKGKAEFTPDRRLKAKGE